MKTQSNKKHAVQASVDVIRPEVQTTWPSLTGIRGMAALWVLLLHGYVMSGSITGLWPPIEWLMAMGRTGVDIFFTLSAFLLSVPFAEASRRIEPRPNLLHYAKRRFSRIVPAYYLQILVLLAMAIWGVGVGTSMSSWTSGGVLAHMLFWINAWPLVPAYLPTWWTLPVELSFYLLLPWLANFLTDRRWYWLLLGVALSFFYRQLLLGMDLTQSEQSYWIDHLPGRLFEFLVGMLAAFFFVKLRFQRRLPKEKNRNRIIFGSTVVLLALPAMGWLFGDKVYLGAATGHPVLAFWHLYASICIAVLIMAISSGCNFADGLLQSSPLQWFGRISYGLYLWHYPVMVLVRESMGGLQAVRADFPSFFVASFFISITLAFLSWHWLEAPILRWAAK